jgi:hypothetical protein
LPGGPFPLLSIRYASRGQRISINRRDNIDGCPPKRLSLDGKSPFDSLNFWSEGGLSRSTRSCFYKSRWMSGKAEILGQISRRRSFSTDMSPSIRDSCELSPPSRSPAGFADTGN